MNNIFNYNFLDKQIDSWLLFLPKRSGGILESSHPLII